MGKVKKRQQKYQYNKDRRKAWKKKKKLPTILCDPVKDAWDEKKSLVTNMTDMGLSVDPNKTMKVLSAKASMKKSLHLVPDNEEGRQEPVKIDVQKALEEEANQPRAKTLKISDPEVQYCIYMIEKYGEDYKKMARDHRNYYQDTPKQIKRKICTFKSIPAQYKAYLKSKEEQT